MDEFDPTLRLADIMEMFNCSQWGARQFLKRYGVKMMSGGWVIGLRKARHLQLSGEAAEFFRRANEDNHKDVRKGKRRNDTSDDV